MKRITQFILCLVLAVSGYGQGVGGNSVPRTVSGISNALDLISSTQGTVFYRGASGWEALTPGTSGQLLSTQGAAANPIWVTATGGAGDVNGPGASTANAIARYNGTGGTVIKDSAVTIADTTGSVSINGTDTATAVNTGGFKSANFGLSTVSAGASYFGGDVIATGNATTVFRSTAANNNAIAGVVITTGNGGSLQSWLVAGNVSGASGEFVIRDSTAVASALTITKSTLAATFGGAVTIAGTVIHTLSATPASASAAGTVGTMSWDANYIYICTATNTWKRVAIATW